MTTYQLVKPLTPRQQEVLDELAQGSNYRTIGNALGIEPRTVRIHVREISERLIGPDNNPKHRALHFALEQKASAA